MKSTQDQKIRVKIKAIKSVYPAYTKSYILPTADKSVVPWRASVLACHEALLVRGVALFVQPLYFWRFCLRGQAPQPSRKSPTATVVSCSICNTVGCARCTKMMLSWIGLENILLQILYIIWKAIVENRWSYALRWCDYDVDRGECVPDVTPILVERRLLMDEKLVVEVKRPLFGQEKVYHYEPQRAHMLVWMESENVSVCKHSNSSHLDDLAHPRFFYDFPLQLADSWKLLKPLLELFNYLITQSCGIFTSDNADSIILDTLAVDTNARLS